jgi:hypothetical protein
VTKSTRFDDTIIFDEEDIKLYITFDKKIILIYILILLRPYNCRYFIGIYRLRFFLDKNTDLEMSNR